MGYNTRGQPQGIKTAGQYVISAIPCGLVSITLDNGAKTLCTATIHDVASAPPGADTVVVQLATKSTISYSPCKPDACSKGIVLTVAGAAAKCTLSLE